MHARLVRSILAGSLFLAVAGPLPAGDIHGKVICKGMRDSAGVVVYVDTIPGTTFSPPATHPVMNQKNLLFLPHVLPVLVGTTVDFLNLDTVLHNVFSPDACAAKFNLGSWPKGETRTYTFKKECFATLLCNVHPEMEANVVALPTPYFAVTDTDGTYKMPDVPDGSYTVKSWRARLKGEVKTVAVHGSTQADFEVHP